MPVLELKVPPLLLWAVMVAGAAAVAYLLPGARWPFPGQRVLATAAALTGVAIIVAAAVQFRRAQTTINPLSPTKTTLMVTTGVYRFSRNPMYLGMALALLAVALWWASLAAAVLVPLFCAYITRFQIRPEERALLAAFGQDFSAYQGSVRRWI